MNLFCTGVLKGPKSLKERRRAAEDHATSLRAMFFHIRREWYRGSSRSFMKNFPKRLDVDVQQDS